jgi:hypothetical protein
MNYEQSYFASSIYGTMVIKSSLVSRFVHKRVRIRLPGRGITVQRLIETDEPLILQLGGKLLMHPDTWAMIQKRVADEMTAEIQKQFDRAAIAGFMEALGYG